MSMHIYLYNEIETEFVWPYGKGEGSWDPTEKVLA
jgi:hypothetical protein